MLCSSCYVLGGLLRKVGSRSSRATTLVPPSILPISRYSRLNVSPMPEATQRWQDSGDVAEKSWQRLTISIPEPLAHRMSPIELHSGPVSPLATSAVSLDEQESPTLGGSFPRWPFQELGSSRPISRSSTITTVNFSRPHSARQEDRASKIPALGRPSSPLKPAGAETATLASPVENPEKAKVMPANAQISHSSNPKSPSNRRFPVKPAASAHHLYNRARGRPGGTRFPIKTPQSPSADLAEDTEEAPNFSRTVIKRSSTVPPLGGGHDFQHAARPKMHRTNTSVSSTSSIHSRLRLPSIEGRLEGQPPWIYNELGKVIAPRGGQVDLEK
jgi:hypothetical protein